LLTLASLLGVLLGVEQVFLTDVRLDGERVLLRTTQFDLTADEKMKSAAHSFTYDTVAASYQREIKLMMERHFAPETLTKKTEGAIFYGRWDAGGGLVNAGSGVCMGRSCQEFRRDVLFYGGIATGGLFLTGGILAFLGKHNNDKFRSSPQGSPEANSAASAGKAEAVAGDILLGLGVATLVTGTVLYFFYHPSPSADDVLSRKAAWVPQLDVAPLAHGGAMVGTWDF
jgi:hypothetical protein